MKAKQSSRFPVLTTFVIASIAPRLQWFPAVGRPWRHLGSFVVGLLSPLLFSSVLAQTPGGSAIPTDTSQTVLATVGERVLTYGELQESWDRLMPTERPQAHSHREEMKKLLDMLIIRHLLALEAIRVGQHIGPSNEAELRDLREKLMKNELYVEKVMKLAEVKEVDIELFRRELTRYLELRAFVFPTIEGAQGWHTQIIQGRPISDLEAALGSGSDGFPRLDSLGVLRREDMPDSVARVLFMLEPGQISRPLPREDGWALYQLTRVDPRIAFVTLSDPEAVMEKASRLREPEARRAFQLELRNALQVSYHEEAIDTLLQRFLLMPPRTSTTESGATNYQVVIPPPPAVVSDSSLILAESRDGRVTGRDVLRFIAATPPIERQEIRSHEDLKGLIDRVVVDGELLRRAEALNMDEHPRVRSKLERNREGMMAEALYEDSVAVHVPTDLDSMRVYYEENMDRYVSPEAVRVWMLIVNDKSLIDSLATQAARPGANLDAMARRYSTSPTAQNGGISELLYRGTIPSPAIEDTLFATPLNEFGGPFPTGAVWLLFKVLEKQPRFQMDFDQALEFAEQDYRVAYEERLMQAFLARLRERHPVVVYEDRLDAVVGAGGS